MAVSRCPHCDQLLLPDELLAPACANCGGALPGVTAEAEAPTTAPAPVPSSPPPRLRTPWLLWAAVVALTVSNGATLAWMFWHGGADRPASVPHENAIADASPREAAVSTIKPINDSPKMDEPSSAGRPVAPAGEAQKPPAPPPAPMTEVLAPIPPAPPPVAAAPNPPVPLPPPAGLADIEGMQGRIDWNDAGDVVGLRLGNSGLSDDELCLLQPFDHLQELDLDHTPVTDKGLIYLRRLKALRGLSLRGAAVTDAGVAALQQALPGVKIVR